LNGVRVEQPSQYRIDIGTKYLRHMTSSMLRVAMAIAGRNLAAGLY
jgi:hypothetical protein